MKRSFPADQKSLSTVRDFVRTQSHSTMLPQTRLDELVLAVSEACALILRHSLDPVIVLSWELGGDAIEVTVENQGVLEPWVGRSEVERGEFVFMEELVDQVQTSSDVQTGRRQVRLLQKLPVPGTRTQ